MACAGSYPIQEQPSLFGCTLTKLPAQVQGAPSQSKRRMQGESDLNPLSLLKPLGSPFFARYSALIFDVAALTLGGQDCAVSLCR